MRLCPLAAVVFAFACTSGESTGGSGDEEVRLDDTSSADDTAPPDTGDAVAPSDALVAQDALHPTNGIVHIMDIAGSGDLVFLAAYAGLLEIDATDPADLGTAESSSGSQFYWTATIGSTVVAAGRDVGVGLFEFGDGGLRGQARVESDEARVEGVALADDAVFIATQDQGLLVLDPSDLSTLGSAATTNAVDVAVLGDIAWVLDREDGLVGFDVSDPTAPAEIGRLPEVVGAAGGLDGDGALVAVAMGSRLSFVNVSDPEWPIVAADVETRGTAQRVSVDGALVAIANWTDVRLYDASDPTDPILVAVEDAEEFATSVYLGEDLLWIGDWETLRSYSVDATARSPEISFEEELDVTGDEGEEATETLLVGNEGPLALAVAAISCDDGVAADPSVFTVPAGGQQAVVLSVTVSSSSQSQLSCTIASDDVDEPEASLDLIVNRRGLGVGDAAPDFSLPATDGATYTLSDYRGQVVFVTIFSPI